MEITRIQGALRQGAADEALRPAGSPQTQEFEQAYHSFVRQWHPDRFFSRDVGQLGGVIDENFALVTRWFQDVRRNPSRSPGSLPPGRPPSPGSSPPTPNGPRVSPPSRSSDAASAGSLASGSDPGRASLETSFRRPGTLPPAPGAQRPLADSLRRQLSAHTDRARRYFAAGKADLEAGRLALAETNLYLASRFDPTNAEYVALHREASARSRQARAATLVAEGARAETYAQRTEAITRYQKAIELEPADGVAYFRLGQLLRPQEEELRNVVQLFRKAVAKEPGNIEYAMALAGVYETLGLKENARTLAERAAAIDRTHPGARSLLKRLKAE